MPICQLQSIKRLLTIFQLGYYHCCPCRPSIWIAFLTVTLHRGLRNDFFSFLQFTFFAFYLVFYSLCLLDVYFPFLFRLLFPFSIWTSIFFFNFFFSTLEVFNLLNCSIILSKIYHFR
jgi:hypothetical protein